MTRNRWGICWEIWWGDVVGSFDRRRHFYWGELSVLVGVLLRIVLALCLLILAWSHGLLVVRTEREVTLERLARHGGSLGTSAWRERGRRERERRSECAIQ